MLISASDQPPTPTAQQTLDQYLADLQKHPDDNIIREKTIKLVQTMQPAPAIPEEAKKYMDRGMAAADRVRDAKDEKSRNDSIKDAIDEFQSAVNLAPWLGDGYRNLGIMQDKGGQYSQALSNLKLYLMTHPLAEDAMAANKLMDEIESRRAKAERWAKGSSPESAAQNKPDENDAWLKSLDGARFVADPMYDNLSARTFREVDYISGREVRCCLIWGENIDLKTAPLETCSNPMILNGKQFEWRRPALPPQDWVVCTGTISDDGQSIKDTCKTRILRRVN